MSSDIATFPAPREHFAYCPRCGAAASPGGASKAFYCDSCGFALYFNVACAVGGLIVDDSGRLLVVRRAKEPAKGLLVFPGGFADPDETAETGLLREIFEEVGLRAEVTNYLCSYQNSYAYRGVTYPVLDLFYLCRLLSSADDSLTLQASEIAGYAWRDPETIRRDEIAFPSQWCALQRYREP